MECMKQKDTYIMVLLLCLMATDATDDKRLILHDDVAMASLIQNMSIEIHKLNDRAVSQDKTIADLQARINQLESDRTQSSGFSAGNWYGDHGSAADYICLPQDPTWGEYVDGVQSHHGLVYGVEYEFGEQHSDGGARFFGKNVHDHDVPCAVCRSGRPSVVMIPGRNQCYPGWTTEYKGYLVTGRDDDASASNYACLDSRPETESGDSRNDNGKLMVIAEVYCGSLKCDPYVQGRELACVVCSK